MGISTDSDTESVAERVKKVSVRTGRRIRAKNIQDDYDVIVIGSGIGGLTNAALLSLLGKKVCVLEQHYTAGGFTHAYQRKGYEWDVGVHYIGEVHNPKSALRKIFDTISEGRLKWAEMDPVYDKIIIGNEQFNFTAGRENFVAELVAKFPEEKQSIEQYVALIRQISKNTPKFFMAQALPPFLAKIYNHLRPLFVQKEFFQTAREVLEGITSNQELISVLTGQWGDYGQLPRDASFVIHALIAKHYLAGGAYPVGGASAMAREIIPTIVNRGGNVFVDAEVDEVLIKDNCAYGVKLTDGTEIKAKSVVSNAGFMNTVERFLPSNVKQKLGVKNWTQQVERSSGSLCLYAGFKGTTEELGLNTTNLWIYPNGKHEDNVDKFFADFDFNNNPTPDLPLVYISFPSTKDPEWNERFPNKSTVEIVTLTKMDWFKKWDGTSWNERGEDYEKYKEELAQQLLSVLFKHRPQLEKALDYYELSTPLSTQFYQLNAKGEIYGLNHHVDRFKKSFLHPQMPIKNLYLTGADVLTAGVGGGLMGGVFTTMRMVGLRGMKKVQGLFTN